MVKGPTVELALANTPEGDRVPAENSRQGNKLHDRCFE